MNISVNDDLDTPIFEQLIQQVKAGVSNGEISPGFALPSIRQLANDLSVNQNTVAKAYRILERDLIIVTRGYRGTFIHADAVSNCDVDLKQTAHEDLKHTVTHLREIGLTDSEIRIAFSSVMKAR